MLVKTAGTSSVTPPSIPSKSSALPAISSTSSSPSSTPDNQTNLPKSLIVSSPTTTLPPSPSFVQRQGQGLSLNGKKFTMVGFNIWKANISYPQPDDVNYFFVNSTSGNNNTGTKCSSSTCITLTDSLNNISNNGTNTNINTIRSWFFQEYTNPMMVNGVPSFNWTPFDNTLSQAASKGFKVIAVLANQGGGPTDGPPLKTQAWYSSGYKTEVDSGTEGNIAYHEVVPYYQYVQAVVERYKNNPAIAAWELINEPSTGAYNCNATAESQGETALYNFISNVGGMIKSIDSNHLVSLGVTGHNSCGIEGGDYQTIMSNPYLDLCTFHDYSEPSDAAAAYPPTGPSLGYRASQCAADNKPIAIEEAGIDLDSSDVQTMVAQQNSGINIFSQNASTIANSLVSSMLNTRETFLGNKLKAAKNIPNMVGYLVWEWSDQFSSSTSIFTTAQNYYQQDITYSKNPPAHYFWYGPADPALAILNRY